MEDKGKIPTKRKASEARLWRRMRRTRSVRWGLRIIAFVSFLAVFGDFLANDRPLYCQIEGKTYFPVLKGYLVDLGLAKWEARFIRQSWKEQDYEAVVFPPVPYSAGSIDARNMNYVGPFEKQRLTAPRFHHWLGTDRYGRDVAAGLISGARISLLVGLLSMLIAGLLGLFIGALAGFYGDDRLRLSLAQLILYGLGLFMGVFGALISRGYALAEGMSAWWEGLLSLAWLLMCMGLAWLLVRLLHHLGRPGPLIRIPLDILVMRTIEVFQSIPVLLLILSVLAIITRPSILYIILIIGLIRWTTIARFVRAELLRIRSLEYMESGRAMGLSDWRLIVTHALPNALTPVIIALAFGIASAILAEAALSFLGIGIPENLVTWGVLLQSARGDVSAWWLAVFPGLLIFLTVTSFNLVGDGLSRAVDSR